MRITHSLVDHDQLCGMYFFDDGTIAVTDEKAYCEIRNGKVVVSHWKETPQSAYFTAICAYDGPEIQMPSRKDDEPSPFQDLCFELTRTPINS